MADKNLAGRGENETGLRVLEKFKDESDGTFSLAQRARLEGWDSIGAAWIKVAVDTAGQVKTTGGGGGGGAVTIADGADVAEGATTDLAVVTDTTGTVSGKLRGLVKWAYERMPASLGQKTMAASLPIVIASDQASIPVTASAGTNLNTSALSLEATQTTVSTRIGDVTETAPATDTASSGLNGRLQRIAQRLTSLIALLPASLGQKTMANGLAVTIASDQSVIPVSDNAGSLTVDAPVGTPVFTRLSDGAAALIGQKAMAASLPVAIASDQGNVPVSQATAANLNAQAVGNVAHDAVDSGNPVKIGGKVVGAGGTPTLVSATGDRVDGAFDAAGRQMVAEPTNWTITHVPAANVQATASKAAGGVGVKHVLTSLWVACHNSGAATAAILTINVRDGATGAGTVLWTLKLPITATTLTMSSIFLNDLNIVGTANTAMTVEFSAAGGANTNEVVNAAGYDTL